MTILIFGGRHSFLGAVGHLERVDGRAGSSDLIEKDFRGDSEAAVYRGVVPHERVSSVDDRLDTAVRAVGRQGHSHLDVVGIVVGDTAAHNQIARVEVRTAVLGSGGKSA